MTLSRQRRTSTLEPGETLETFAARVLPDQPVDAAIDQLKRWNLHVFLGRRPAGQILGSDVVFTEPPAETPVAQA